MWHRPVLLSSYRPYIRHGRRSQYLSLRDLRRRTLSAACEAEGNAARDVLPVAEDDSGVLNALVSGTAADDDPTGSIAEIEAL
jgi:hypothetical protein